MNKIVLAYSGGLDTSVILKWLMDKYNARIITFTADLGQGVENDRVKEKALSLGVREEDIFIDDLKEEFVKDYVYPMFRANAVYEGEYLLGTSIARPLIAKRQMQIAKKLGANAVSHGATGKGNDQIRFELSYLSIDPNIKVISPWREWDLNSRTKLLAYAKANGIEIDTSSGENPYSIDSNLLHTSYEGGVLEDPYNEADEAMWQVTSSLKDATEEEECISIGFKKGDPISINGEILGAAELLGKLNDLGSKHGIGRADIVENRFIGMKSRGCYETPGGSILLKAHRAIESISLDKEAAHLKDDLMPRYAKLIYNGFWFFKEREILQALIDKSQENVEGEVKLKLYKGNIIVLGRKSNNSLYSSKHSTFEKDDVYNQKDAEGFIKLNALRAIIAGINNN